MAIQISELGDIAGKFNISNEEAERIAATVDSEAAFVDVWQNTDWWTDDNNGDNQMNIQINRKTIDLTNATTSVEDYNTEDEKFNASAVQVDVFVDGVSIAFQTSSTLDAGGVSSKLMINAESGAYDSVLKLLQEHDALSNDEDEDDDVYAAGLAIGEALNVQKSYDEYLQEIGEWENGGGMDANSETFVSH